MRVACERLANVLGRLERFQEVHPVEGGTHGQELVHVEAAAFDHRAERPEPENSMVPSSSIHPPMMRGSRGREGGVALGDVGGGGRER